MYQRDTVKMPFLSRRARKMRQPSTMYRPFSDSAYAPAPVAAHVSMSDIVITL